MSGLGWQDALVTLAALGALAWLVRRRLRRKSAGCEDCIRTAVEARDARTGATVIPIASLGRVAPGAGPQRDDAGPAR